MADGALCACVVSIVAACNASPSVELPSGPEAKAGAHSVANVAATVSAKGAASVPMLALDDSPPKTTASCASSVNCKPAGGQYCGHIGDGCGKTVDCGSCPSDWTCSDHLCVGGPSCQPLSCETGTTRFCDTVGDGCGRELDCGDCPAGETCRAGVCVKDGCVPLTCETEGGRFCGTIGDGCGGTLECGDCPGGGLCGGGGVENLCWDPSCTRAQCKGPNGGQYCGKIGDGCGGVLDCGSCADDWVCQDHLCVGGASCSPFSCQQGATQFCGAFGDGCGNEITCSCAAGETCRDQLCTKNGCTPLTCETAAGRFCGTVGDGCGGKLDCGACPNGGVCGDGGIEHMCWDPNCPRRECTGVNGGSYCGQIGDGCGGVQDCGSCPGDWTCEARMCVGGGQLPAVGLSERGHQVLWHLRRWLRANSRLRDLRQR
ncbi:hypothetical protein ACFL5O_05775 [Myxococcota bacterium]